RARASARLVAVLALLVVFGLARLASRSGQGHREEEEVLESHDPSLARQWRWYCFGSMPYFSSLRSSVTLVICVCSAVWLTRPSKALSARIRNSRSNCSFNAG